MRCVSLRGDLLTPGRGRGHREAAPCGFLPVRQGGINMLRLVMTTAEYQRKSLGLVVFVEGVVGWGESCHPGESFLLHSDSCSVWDRSLVSTPPSTLPPHTSQLHPRVYHIIMSTALLHWQGGHSVSWWRLLLLSYGVVATCLFILSYLKLSTSLQSYKSKQSINSAPEYLGGSCGRICPQIFFRRAGCQSAICYFEGFFESLNLVFGSLANELFF